jgi:1,4-dihydroxy-6-naphthoate synthase
LQDIQTLNERATRGELDIRRQHPRLRLRLRQIRAAAQRREHGRRLRPDACGQTKFSREEIAKKKIAVPGTMTSAFLALQLWLGKPAKEFNYVVVPFDQIFSAVKNGTAEVGLIIHEGQLTYQNEGLVVCEDLGVWWGRQNDGLPLPLGGNVIHKKFDPATRRKISDTLTASIQFSLDHRPKPCSTRCNTRATWAAISPTNSLACMSTTGRWITAKKAGNPSAVFSATLLSAA